MVGQVNSPNGVVSVSLTLNIDEVFYTKHVAGLAERGWENIVQPVLRGFFLDASVRQSVLGYLWDKDGIRDIAVVEGSSGSNSNSNSNISPRGVTTVQSDSVGDVVYTGVEHNTSVGVGTSTVEVGAGQLDSLCETPKVEATPAEISFLRALDSLSR